MLDGGAASPVSGGREADFAISLPLSLVGSALSAARKELDDELLGLHVGVGMRTGRWGQLGDLVKYSESLGSALVRCQSIWSMVNSYSSLGVRIERGFAEVAWECPQERPSPELEDLVLTSCVAMAREVVGGHFPLAAVYLRRPSPKDASAHESFFGCPVRFRQALSMVRAPSSVLMMPSRSPDGRAAQRAERAVVGVLSARSQVTESSFVTAVRTALEGCVPHGIPTVEAVADQLRIPPRDLRRRLKALGTSFRALRDGVLRSLAIHYLRSSEISLDDVAEKVGFSEQSAFSRAFKNWTGTTPGAFRASYKTAARVPGDVARSHVAREAQSS